MLFNSYLFIFLFLPVLLVGYFLIARTGSTKAVLLFLTAMSLVFYGYNSIPCLFILLISMILNALFAKGISGRKNAGKKGRFLFLLSLLFNIGLLFVFKYLTFFLDNMNVLFHTQFTSPSLVLPLGISFYTFQQIAYLVDIYRGDAKPYGLLQYASFITFFPTISSGPIAFHSELIPQFLDPLRKKLSFVNLSRGCYAFSLGLAKKVLLADTLSKVVSVGYSNITELNSYSTVIVMLCYSLQIYFDFSGYCDMALGIAKMLNLDLPINFNSPYKAASIVEFWDRWHMTLTRFFTRYIYIPLGGSRRGQIRTVLNIMIVFFISGLWHGASWTFVLWGVLHGLLNVLEKILHRKDWKLPRFLGRGFIFTYVTLAWSIFRAPTLTDSMQLFRQLFSGGLALYQPIRDEFQDVIEVSFLYRAGFGSIMESCPWLPLTVFVLVLMVACFTMKNTQEKVNQLSFNKEGTSPKRLLAKGFVTVVLLFFSILSLADISEFLYFTF